jgi:hypothetical protein
LEGNLFGRAAEKEKEQGHREGMDVERVLGVKEREKERLLEGKGRVLGNNLLGRRERRRRKRGG